MKLSMFARIFGNEKFYHHMKDEESIFKTFEAQISFLKSLLNRKSFSYTHTQNILEGAMTVPTAAG